MARSVLAGWRVCTCLSCEAPGLCWWCKCFSNDALAQRHVLCVLRPLYVRRLNVNRAGTAECARRGTQHCGLCCALLIMCVYASRLHSKHSCFIINTSLCVSGHVCVCMFGGMKYDLRVQCGASFGTGYGVGRAGGNGHRASPTHMFVCASKGLVSDAQSLI